MLKRSRRIMLLAAVGLVLGVAGAAHAVPVSFDIWYEFAFTGAGVAATGCSPADPGGPGCVPSSGTPTVFVGAPPWTFVAPEPGAVLTVTDAFSRGDAFTFSDFGVPILTTPPVAAAGACGDDPVVCRNDPLVSHGTVSLAPGPHSLTATAVVSPFDAGAAYFTINPVPEPSTLVLLGSALTGAMAGLWRRARRQRRHHSPRRD